MDNFYNVAIMLIYPDGYIDKMYVDKETLHAYYYKDLSTKSSRFNQIVNDKNMDIDNYDFEYNIDLSDDNIIVINNIDIKKIAEDKYFSKTHVPDFLFSIPEELTEEQKSVLLGLFENNYLSNAAYAHFRKEGSVPINYYELLNSLYVSKRKK